MSQRIKLTDDVQRLVDAYLEKSDKSFDDLANSALRIYLVNKLSSKEVANTLQHNKDESYDVKDLLENSFGNWYNDRNN